MLDVEIHVSGSMSREKMWFQDQGNVGMSKTRKAVIPQCAHHWMRGRQWGGLTDNMRHQILSSRNVLWMYCEQEQAQPIIESVAGSWWTCHLLLSPHKQGVCDDSDLEKLSYSPRQREEKPQNKWVRVPQNKLVKVGYDQHIVLSPEE